jgi:hypothetical protein
VVDGRALSRLALPLRRRADLETFAIAPHADFLPTKRGLLHRDHDVVSPGLRHLDEREVVRDLNRAKLTRGDKGFSRDRADEIRRANAGRCRLQRVGL